MKTMMFQVSMIIICMFTVLMFMGCAANHCFVSQTLIQEVMK